MSINSLLVTFNCAFFTNSGWVKGIKKDCFHDTTGDEGLRRVIEKWHGRTVSEKRTWQTLLDVATTFDDHTLSQYLNENGIPCKQVTVCMCVQSICSYSNYSFMFNCKSQV